MSDEREVRMNAEVDVRNAVRAQGERARDAACVLARSDDRARCAALAAMARALRAHADRVIEANARDVADARAEGVSESLVDRLLLNPERIEDAVRSLGELAALPDPVGRVLEARTLASGARMERISVPLGVVAVVYEARPNVTVDAAGICVRSGNAALLRGGGLAVRTNVAIAALLRAALVEVGLPASCVEYVDAPGREAAEEMMRLRGLVDVLVPRGGRSLIDTCVRTSTVPVIETGTGNCHVYVHTSADPAMALGIVLNAKCRRYGVCNAAETLLVDEACASEVLPAIAGELAVRGVTLHADELALPLAAGAGATCLPADEHDWKREYLAPHLAVRVVSGLDEAVEHIRRFGTRHSECIVAQDEAASAEFCARVDAAAVYVNVSTAFTDGGQFGLGAEVGISTQKLHVRGPFSCEGLVSYKYVVRGEGQVRP
ncbi:glutamate-5-semialdehyde dehydrogenase [Berryella wangjianweii]|nr:glutamate-5-semialdehyde dehydrogenase [Berryella wangjianweii]